MIAGRKDYLEPFVRLVDQKTFGGIVEEVLVGRLKLLRLFIGRVCGEFCVDW